MTIFTTLQLNAEIQDTLKYGRTSTSVKFGKNDFDIRMKALQTEEPNTVLFSITVETETILSNFKLTNPNSYGSASGLINLIEAELKKQNKR